jgi:hypothetical protein
MARLPQVKPESLTNSAQRGLQTLANKKLTRERLCEYQFRILRVKAAMKASTDVSDATVKIDQ